MKKLLFILSFFVCGKIAAQHDHTSAKPDTSQAAKPKPKSPRQSAMEMVAENHVHIDYGSPSVRGRQIWNGLVAYGQVWATGAHKATWIDFGQAVTIGGKLIPKGRYGVFTIPNKKKWTIILNKTWDMHLADDYNAENDILRLDVKPKKSKVLTESLTFEVVAKGKKSGKINVNWEWVSVGFEFENAE
jgi:hypothetical protein